MNFVRVVMSTTALVFGAAGVAVLFLPLEVNAYLDLGTGREFVLQILGAGFLALATLNWMGRGAIYGGVFGRPVVLANLMFGVVSSLSLVSTLMKGGAHPLLWIIAVGLSLHALAFAFLLRFLPYPREP